MMTYGSYVWTAYAIAFAVIALNCLRSYRYYRKVSQKVSSHV